MTRPSPQFLALALVAVFAALGGASLLKGGLYIGLHEGDTLHLLQITLRLAQGDWPHLDFQTPIGLFATAPIALFVWLGAGIGHAFVYAQVFLAALALPAIWWVSISRFRSWASLIFGGLTLVMILAMMYGDDIQAVSVSMHYNRWAWAAAFLAIAIAILPPREGWHGPHADGLVLGAALAVMLLTKITFFAAFSLPILVGLAGRGAWRTVLLAAVTVLVVALCVTLLVGTPAFWVGYLRDLLIVMASEVRSNPGKSLNAIVAAPAFVGANFVLLATVIILRLSGRLHEGLVLLLLVPGFLYVTYQNYGNDPQWLWILGLLIYALLPEPGGRLPVLGEPRQASLLAIAASAAFAAPSVLNLTASPFRHLATDTEDYVPLLASDGVHADIYEPQERAYRVDAQIAFDTPDRPFASYYDADTRKAEEVTFQGEALPQCETMRGTVAWFETLAGDLIASGLTDGKTLFPADILSPFWVFGAGEPLDGASPWYYGGLPGWDKADYLLVPLCPLMPKVRKLILDDVTEAGTALQEVRRTETYILFAKATSEESEG